MLAVPAAAKLKLPATRSTGTNLFTLLALHQASASHPAVDAELKICATSKAPADNFVEPELFSIVAGGATVAHRGSGPRQPALNPEPLPPGRCVVGWLTWPLPGHQRVTELIYSFVKTVTWRVG